MSPPARSILLVLLLAGLPATVVLITGFAASSGHLPTAARILLPAAASLAAGMAAHGWAIRAGHRRTRILAERDAIMHATAAAEIADLHRNAVQMRHDLRGILSPALLTADRLAMSADPAARRAGEAMISTVERAEERLRRP